MDAPAPTATDPPAPALQGGQASDILEGPLDGPLVRLAVPLLVGYLANLGFNWLNMWFVEHISEAALAAVSSAAYVLWGMISLAEVASVGTLALAARAIGARDRREAGAAALNGVALAGALALTVALAGPLLAPWLTRALGLDGEAGALATRYLEVLFWSYPALALFLSLEAVCRAAGETAVPMAVLAVSFTLNALLDWLLIFGVGPLPELGVAGAAIATAVARSLGVVALLGYVAARHEALGLTWPGWRLEPARLARIARIGAPAAAAGVGFAAIYVALNAQTAAFGTAAVAALGVGLRIEGLAFLIAQAIGRAAATMAGQNLGAGQVDRARAAVRRALGHAWLAMCPLMLAMVLAPRPIAELFVPHQPVVAVVAASYLQIAGFALLGMALEVVLENVAGGVGDTLPAMAIEVVGTALRIPIASGLALMGLGYHSVWWAVASTCFLKGLAFWIWFRRSGWAGRGS